MSLEAGRGEFPIDDITESDEGLLDSDREEVKGQQPATAAYPDVGELDYDELMENEGIDDEVKVHVSEDIEEGEVTSDEEGEIKESDDDDAPTERKEEPPTATPTPAKPPADAEVTTTTSSGKTTTDKDATEPKPTKKKTVVEGGSSSEEGSVHSSEGKDPGSVDGGGRGEGKGGDKSRGGGENVEKLPTVCRHFLGGKCNWGNNCRFLHEQPVNLKERPKPPPHDRMGGPEFHGGPRNGPWGIPRGFPPPFMPGPMGHPHDLPPHMDPMGPMPLPPPGRGGYRMHPMAPYGHMHSRDMPPGRPFDPMSPRGMEEHRVYPRHGGGGGGRSGKKSGKVSEVTEETDGWMRLRTVTQDWSSDEEQGERIEGDLRDRIKAKRGRESDSDSDKERRPHPQRGAEDWTDPLARDLKRDRLGKKKRKKASSSEEASDSEEEERRRSKKTKYKKPSGGRKGRKKSESSEESSDSDEKSKKKKKKKDKKAKRLSPSSPSSSDSESEVKKRKKKKDGGKKKKKKAKDDDSSDEEETRTRKTSKKGKQGRHLGSPSPPADPRRYGMRDDYPYPPHPFPPHLPPDDRHHWPPHPHHPHASQPFDFPPGLPPPREHHSPKKDQFGRDISKRLEYEDSRRHRRGERHAPPPYHDEYPPHPPHRPGPRDLGMWDPRRMPHPFMEGHKRRRSSEDMSRSPTPLANPDSDLSEEESGRGRYGKNKRSKSSDSEMSMSRREKLLRQELDVIDKAIAKKKYKKRSY